METKDRDAIVLGNGKPAKYREFKIKVEPVANLLSLVEKKKCIEQGFIKLDKFGNPIDKSQ